MLDSSNLYKIRTTIPEKYFHQVDFCEDLLIRTFTFLYYSDDKKQCIRSLGKAFRTEITLHNSHIDNKEW